ncbi:MAG: DUF1289 domain-containing protein [Pseudolabrys sp.]
MIETPCIQVCTLDPRTDLCRGCGRSIEVVGGWSGMTAEERRGIMAELPARQATAKARLEKAQLERQA